MPEQQKWDTSYEWKAVTLLGLGFGLVGLDRWIIAPLFPFIAKDLGFSYQDIGNIIGALGLVWGIFAIVSGRLSDSIGHRKVLIPAILLFSLISGVSGMAVGLVSLITIRGIMGLMEGSFCPTSFTATAAASHPSRRGFLQGLQQSGFALFGFGIGPIIATQLLRVVPSWRYVFWVVAIPGFIIGALLYFVLREPADTQGGAEIGAVQQAEGDGSKGVRLFVTIALIVAGIFGFLGQFGFIPSKIALVGVAALFTAGVIAAAKCFNKNIVICMLGLLCAMACIFVLGGLLPNYLTDYQKLSVVDMGFVTSALGFGGFFGQFGVPGISDFLGRRITAVLAFLGAALTVWLFMGLGPSPWRLFCVLFLISFFSLGNVALITGPIATESAPAGLISSAIGTVVGSGEIFGGGLAPSIGGSIAQHYGIHNILWMPLVGVIVGIVACSFLTETAPRKIAGRVKQAEKRIESELPA